MKRCTNCNGHGFTVGAAEIEAAIPGANNDAWCQVMRCDICCKFDGDTSDELIDVFIDKSGIDVPVIIAHSIYGDTYLWVNRYVLQTIQHYL